MSATKAKRSSVSSRQSPESSDESTDETFGSRRKLRRESAVEAKKKLLLQSSVSPTSKTRSQKDKPTVPLKPGASSDRCGSDSEEAAIGAETFCDRGCCTEIFPGCCAEISENCMHDMVKDLNKWVHISDGEHLCQACYDEFSKLGKSYSENFRKWKMAWSLKSRREPLQKLFAAEELLPFWLQCSKCNKWRWLKRDSLDPSFVKSFHCGMVDKKSFIDEKLVFVDIKMCTFPEDPRVSDVRDSSWVRNLTVPGLLWSSPANFFLNDEYYDDEVGMSPTHLNKEAIPTRDESLENVMQPFYVPTESCRALCLRPDVMEYDELVEFSEYVTEQAMYLGLRNLIITLWNMNPKEWLTPESCAAHVILRGLVRIRCVGELERIIRFLTLKGIINYGLLTGPCPFPVTRMDPKKPLRVIVVGAGISGLTVARQLTNFGLNVTVLEATNKIGGRMKDDWTLGVSVGKGAQLVTGLLNNPLIVMCHQGGVAYRPVTEECPLIDSETGNIAVTASDKRVDFHFNCLLDAIADWRSKSPEYEDHSVEEFLMHVHQSFLKESKLKWTEEEERLLQFQLGNLEFSCGARLSDVSARHWDQNEQFAQFAGDHALLTDGGEDLCTRIARGLDIRCNSKVLKVEHSWKKITVHTKKETKHSCDKLVVALPLAVLQSDKVIFEPELPRKKMVALRSLGAGIIEKVAVKFPRKFWASRISGADYFGHVPATKESRGLFNMFYDFSTRDPKAKHQSYVLMSYVCGSSVDIVNQKSDQEVAQIFVETLEKLFPEEDIPEPEGCIVTHWARDSCFGMSYSYVKTGSTGNDYDTLAEDVEKKIFFAGETTNRHFPQTITGAYLSGLREAGKIVSSFH